MASQSQRRLSCVKCQVFQPVAGKLLSCLHVICASCAADESNAESNSIKCGDCGKLTKALLDGVPICSQLANCRPHLYRVAENCAKSTASAGIHGESNLYCEWCDDDAMAEATHECERCGSALFCRKHAERHKRARACAGHLVRELSRAGDAGGKPHVVCCLLHNNCVPVTFCQTCTRAVCTECLAGGHEGHTIIPLKSQAAREQELLREAMQSSMPEYPPQSASMQSGGESDQITSPFDMLISGVSAEMEKIQKEAEEASCVVTNAFGRLEAAVKEQQQQDLHRIENMMWKQLEVQESKQQRLYHLQEKHATVMDLTQSLTSSDAGDTDVIQLAGDVKHNLRKLPSDLSELQLPPYHDPIIAVPHYSLSDTECRIRSLIKFHDIVDLSNSTLSVPGVIHTTGGEYNAKISFPMPSFNPTPSLSGTVLSPSGQCSSISIGRCPNCSNNEVAMCITIQPTEVGDHKLEIRHADGKVKLATFNCQPALRLDPEKCTSGITLSAKNQVATHTGKSRLYYTVAADVGYTTGSHSWNVKFLNCGDHYTCVGVTVLPEDGNYKDDSRMSSYYFYNSSCYYSTDLTGTYQRKNCASIEGCISSFNDGDTATFTLDCDKRTLEVDQHRTKKRLVFSSIQCHTPLYPAICLRSPQSQVEFY